MKIHSALGLAILSFGAAAASTAGCFSSYAGDCNRDPTLDCFWGTAGGAGGTTSTGGEGGATTTSVEVCGDHHQGDGEACDDGNTDDCDGCRGDCSALETGCGDGFTCGDEECDLGTMNSDTGECTLACLNAACGDGFLQPGEECDDSNTAGGDNCSPDCHVECAIRNLPYGNNPENYSVFLDEASMHCYVHIAKPQKAWMGARTACQDWGGDLFAFEKLSEATAVVAGLPTLTQQSWTAGEDAIDGVFTWANGEMWPVVPPWAAGEPNQVGPGCVSLNPQVLLHDHSCTELSVGAYVCELDLATLQ